MTIAMQVDAAQLEAHRVPLTGHCYRMLGSAFGAEDAVQEAMVRAWQALDRFEGRSIVAALQHLPPRQRAALLLSEVLGWSAANRRVELVPRCRKALSAFRPAAAPAACGLTRSF
jgi:DNA-directed RNA polymerase specialized sigma24 family protein